MKEDLLEFGGRVAAHLCWLAFAAMALIMWWVTR